MTTTATISFIAPDLETFLAALDAMQARGISPIATVAAAPAASPRPAGGHEPNGPYFRYCEAKKITKFKRTAEEKAMGLSMDAAATRRMQVPGWDTVGQLPAGLDVADDDDTPPPPEHDGTPLF